MSSSEFKVTVLEKPQVQMKLRANHPLSPFLFGGLSRNLLKKNMCLRAGERAQFVKYSPCNRKDRVGSPAPL